MGIKEIKGTEQLNKIIKAIGSQPKIKDLLNLTDKDLIINNLLIILQTKFLNCKFNVKDITKSIPRSYEHLSREFHKKTGYTIEGYLIQLRLSSWNNLYCNFPETCLTRLCEEVGFPSYNDFRYHIKRRFMMEPSEYIKYLIHYKKRYQLTFRKYQ